MPPSPIVDRRPRAVTPLTRLDTRTASRPQGHCRPAEQKGTAARRQGGVRARKDGADRYCAARGGPRPCPGRRTTPACGRWGRRHGTARACAWCRRGAPPARQGCRPLADREGTKQRHSPRSAQLAAKRAPGRAGSTAWVGHSAGARTVFLAVSQTDRWLMRSRRAAAASCASGMVPRPWGKPRPSTR